MMTAPLAKDTIHVIRGQRIVLIATVHVSTWDSTEIFRVSLFPVCNIQCRMTKISPACSLADVGNPTAALQLIQRSQEEMA